MPMFVTLATSLPQFQRPFVPTTIPKSFELESASEEKTLDIARSYLMEGMHLLNEVSSCTKEQTEFLPSHQLKFEEGL